MTCNPRAAVGRACLRLCACLAWLGVAPLLAQDATSFVAAEYFWDNDLVTNHVAVAISSDQTVALGYPSGAQLNINLTTLPVGFHQLGLRFQDGTGAWTDVNWLPVRVYDPATSIAAPPTAPIDDSSAWVVYAEYFWDSAPGLSNGIPVSVAPGETFGLGYPGALATNLDLSGLPLGLHNLGFRTIDNLGRVSQTNWLPVQVFDPATVVNTPSIASINDSTTWLVYAESFWDNDPGQGNGTPLAVPPGETLSFGAPSANVLSTDVTSFSGGNHNLGLRTKDFSGRWSDTSWLPIRIASPPVINVQPQSHAVSVGANISLSVVASDALPLLYQWLFNGTSAVPGTTNSFLNLTNFQATEAGGYSVIVASGDGSVTSQMALVTAIMPTKSWTGGGDGVSWTDANNWSGGVLPTSADSIFIGSGTNTITNAGGMTLNNLISRSALSITGSLTVTGAVTVVSSLYLAPGITLTVTGANASFVGEASTTADSVSMYAQQGGLISLWGLTQYNNGYNQSCTLQASGAGSVLDLPTLQTINGPTTALGNGNFLTIRAQQGGRVNLAGVNTIIDAYLGGGSTSMGIQIFADGMNSVVDLSGLQQFLGTEQYSASASLMQVSNGGQILVPNLSYASGLSLYVSDGLTFSLPALTNYDTGYYQSCTLQASGAGSVLDLPALQTINGPTTALGNGNFLTIRAQQGGRINLAGVNTIIDVYLGGGSTSMGIQIFADGMNSAVDLSGLQEFLGSGIYSDSLMSQANGGLILLNSNTVYESVNLSLSPAILTQPQSVRVLAGSTVTFSVLADGNAPLAYQWFFNQTNSLTGATNATLSIPGVSLANVGSYNVIVTNAFGSVASAVVALDLQGPPIIVAQPQNQTVLAGTTAFVPVTATGSEPLVYQWFANGISVINATNATLVLANVPTNQSGIYNVVISNSYGVVTSQVATVTVLNTIRWTIRWTGAGDGFSWNDPRNWNTGVLPTSFDSILIGLGSGMITNQGGMTLNNMVCQRSLALTGSLTVTGLVEVNSAQNLYLAPGITLTVSGANASFISEGSTTADSVFMYAQQGGLISLPGLTEYNTGANFSCTLQASGAGSVLDLPALETITGPTWAFPNNLTIQAQQGGRINMASVNTMSVTYGSQGSWGLGIQIYADGTNSVVDLSGLQQFLADFGYVPSDSLMQPSNGGQILVPNLRNASGLSLIVSGGLTFNLPALTNYINGIAANCTLQASGAGSVLNLPALQTIIGPNWATPNNLTIQAQQGGRINMASVTTMSVTYTYQSGSAAMGIQVYANGMNSVIDLSGLQQFLGSGIYSDSLMSQANGGLILLNTNAVYQNVSFQITPTILTQPQNAMALNGSNAIFSVEADGTPPLSYQWFFNQTNLIGGATTPTLALSGLDYQEVGAYTVVIKNTFGAITSAPASLNLNGTTVTQTNVPQNWIAANSPYFVSANIVAGNLTIQPGVSVLFNGSCSLTITGLLQAVGTSNNVITFAGAGNSNGWQGLRFVSANTNSTMSWCVVQGSTGGGIRLTNTPFTLNSCMIVSNTGVSGGGIYSDSPLLLQNCSLINNSATYSQQGNSYLVQGGGLFSAGGGVTLQSCLVSNNTAIMSNAGVTNETSTGGGIDCESGLLTLNICTVASNLAVGAGQSATEVGGGIYLNNVAATLAASGCTFQGNSAPGGFGGAVALGSGGLNNCVLSGSQATFGGALWIGGAGQTMATNCILAGNTASLGGAVYSSVAGAAGDFENCTLTQNSPDAFNDYAGVIHDSIVYSNGNEIVAGTVAPVVYYCDVRGGYGGPGTNNLDVDPQFADAISYQLAETSPVINAGDPAPQFDDAAFPPSQGSDLNDLGAYGGPGAALWPAFSSAMPVVLVNGQPAAPFQEFTFPVSAPPVITFTNGYAGGFFEYTLDGSNPLDYPTYTDVPFVLTNSAQIRLVAYSLDLIPYTIAAPVTVNVLPGYSLTAGTAGGGGVIPSSGLYLSNTVVSITATNAPGWTFLNWAGDAAGTNNPISIVINGAKNVQAVFGTPLTVTAAGNGTVQTNPVLTLYPYGSTIQLMGVPSSGSSYFRLWGGAAAGNSYSPLNFVVTNANPNVTALFGGLPAGNATLNLLVNGPGTASRNPLQSYYPTGSVMTVTEIPASAARFAGWSGSATGTNNPLSLTLNTSLTVTANFASTNPTPAQPPSITITNPASGTRFAYQSPIQVSAKASDPNLGGSITQAVFYASGNQIALLTNAPFNVSWTNASVGTNVVTAAAYNNFGISTLSAPVVVIVSPPPPGAPIFTLSSSVYSVFENGGFAIVTVQKNLNSLGGTVNYGTANGTALAVSNYQAVFGSLFFASNDISKNVTIPIIYSPVYQGNKSFGFSLSPSGDGSTVGVPGNASVTIVDVNSPSTNPPVFLFGSANYSVNESNGAVVVTVLNNGDLGGLVNYTTADGSAHGGSGYSGSYTIAQGSFTFAAGQHSTNLNIGIRDNFITGADIQFTVQLFNPSAGALGTPATATVTIHQNDIGGATNSLLTTASPTAQPPTAGALKLVLTPPEAGGQWRFPWEQGWHQSGDTVSSLEAGNYPVQFRDVPNYLAYPATLTIAVTNGGTTMVTNDLLPTYTSFDTNSTGSLTVNIGPNTPSGSGWRFIGESVWRSNNVVVPSLLPDIYFIEYEPVGGWTKPGSQAVPVFGGQATIVSANYLLPSALPGGVTTTPSQITPGAITDLANHPYGFNGQLYTDVGYGSGVAVRESVVLTAAHMVFNDASLGYVSQAWWSFQKEAGVFSPEPIAARGWYVLSGYASQRTNDLQVGGYGVDQSSPPSRNLDVAALYFLSPTGRGGYGGYLTSDAVPNPYLTGSNLKTLVGYPVDGSYYGQTVTPGMMYATAELSTALTQASNNVYSAAWFLSYPGNSGGPLYVRFNNYYYPAAVYLGSLGSGQNAVSVVRAINSEVVNLINLASSLGDSGTNFTGGGVITLIAGAVSTSNPALVQVHITPAGAVSAGAGWRLQGQSAYGSDLSYSLPVTSSSAVLEFKPVSGWNLPTNQSLNVSPGQLTVVTANYTVAPPAADLAAGISGPATVPATSNYLYTLLITNLGSSAASSVTVTDTLPAGVVFVGSSGGGTNNAGIVTWPVLVTLPNGGTTNYTLTVRAPVLGLLTNTLSVGSATSDTNAANNNVKLVTLVIIPSPVLVANAANGIGITGTPGTRYRMEYRNSLSSGQWLPLQTNTIGSGINYVLPWPPTNGSAGFYRAVWLP